MSLARRGDPARRTAFGLLALACAMFAGASAEASNPRWTTGPPYFTAAGTAVAWYTNTPFYYTDPGDLSSYVDHAAADALVAAAAATWNVPQSMMVLGQGGTLNEQVSSVNTYLGSSGLVFPNDVQSTNYAAKQIAVIYDRDGSVTDLLLGGGASGTTNCLQNAVTESVDGIATNGTIQHAILILNGRCTGSAPEAQLQLRYQLERALGRVLGVGWSQLNDNVFTGTPQPTYAQALHWPIMHPIDVICGPYTYQCLPDPFTLRDDDIATLVLLYPVIGNVPAGKQVSLAQAGTHSGSLHFPTGEGMAGVNVVLRRNQVPEQVIDGYDDLSATSGDYTMQLLGNPLTPKPSTLDGSFGSIPWGYDIKGFYTFQYIPIPPGKYAQDLLLHTEAINPLYTGAYAIGTYPASPVKPSGSTVSWRFNFTTPGWSYYWEPPWTASAASSCPSVVNGTESVPAPVPAGGWWNEVSCYPNPNNPWVFSRTSWIALPVRGNRTLTAEMTALDEAGHATANKLRPVLGIWSANDALGSRPSLASSAIAFNSVVLGMTAANAQVAQAQTLRLAFSAENGDGRPDYTYQARVLYADTLAPASAGAGTQVTITGTGFRPGNAVTFNGVNASVSSWTANTIVATAPRLAGVLPGQTATVDVAVTDLSTHGTAVMSGAFQYLYTAPNYILQVTSTPTSPQIVSLPATPAFTVKVSDADAVTPLSNAAVVFSVLAGNVSWTACGGASTCTVTTDANGLASIGVTALASGTVTLQAAAVGQTQQVSFQAVPLVRTATVSPQYKYLAAGAVASWTATATFTQQGQPAAQVPLVWASTTGNLTISSAQTVTGSSGTAQASIQGGPITAGAQATGTVCAWGNTCGTITAFGVHLDQLAVVVTGNGTQAIAPPASFLPVSLQITDASGNPVAGATVHIHQATRQWTQPCSMEGRCPLAPVHSAADATILSDSNGNLSVLPLDLGGPEVTSIVVASGNQGYAALTLQRHP